jgi:hypothetical protein
MSKEFLQLCRWHPQRTFRGQLRVAALGCGATVGLAALGSKMLDDAFAAPCTSVHHDFNDYRYYANWHDTPHWPSALFFVSTGVGVLLRIPTILRRRLSLAPDVCGQVLAGSLATVRLAFGCALLARGLDHAYAVYLKRAAPRVGTSAVDLGFHKYDLGYRIYDASAVRKQHASSWLRKSPLSFALAPYRRVSFVGL